MEKPTRALSVRQPFAWAILEGKKKIEYRSRRMNIRERVYIYASLQPREDEHFERLLRKAGLTIEELPRGCILGSVEIIDCQENEDGEWEWKLANPIKFKRRLFAKNSPQPVIWRPEF
jgi:hypothetical protein